MKKVKTYKREVAVLQLVAHWFLVMLIGWMAFRETGADVASLVDLAVGLAVWVYGFAAAAFGLDSWAKQVNPPTETVVNREVHTPPEGFPSG